MNLASLAWRNIWVQRTRTVATFTGIALAVASFVALVGLARGVEQTLKASLDIRGTDVIVTEAGAIDLISSIVSADLVSEIEAFPGVAAAAAELTRMTSLEQGASVLVTAWQVDGYPWQALEVLSGALPGSAGGASVSIGESVAARQALSLGDRIALFQTEFTVVGIVGSKSVLMQNLVFLDLEAAQRLTYREGQATSINVRLDPDTTASERKATVSALKAAFPTHAVAETEQLASGYTYAQIADALSASIALVALASAVLAIYNTMSMAMNERRGEIAIMTAVGWPKWQIIACVLIEGIMLTMTAGLAGCAVGTLAARAVSRSDLIIGFIEPDISEVLLLQACLISLAIGLVGSLVPALRTVRLFPASILRGR